MADDEKRYVNDYLVVLSSGAGFELLGIPDEEDYAEYEDCIVFEDGLVYKQFFKKDIASLQITRRQVTGQGSELPAATAKAFRDLKVRKKEMN